MKNGRWYERGLLHPFIDYSKTPAYLHSIFDPMDSQRHRADADEPGLGQDINFDYIDRISSRRLPSLTRNRISQKRLTHGSPRR